VFVAEAIHEQPGRAGLLVFCGEDGGRLDRNKVKHPFWRNVKEAGVRLIRLHDLRHSFASQLVSAGVNLRVVQDLLGHADIKMTMRYAHLAPQRSAWRSWRSLMGSGTPLGTKWAHPRQRVCPALPRSSREANF
jgi:site-specific recombinase XerD